MLVDCETCPVRGVSCETCVINVLFAPDVASVEGSEATPRALPARPVARERRRQEALRRLRDAGRVRPLWAVPGVDEQAGKHVG